MLLLSGLFKLGKVITLVPHSIVVGFTLGISIVIAFSQLAEVFGFKEKIGYGIVEQISKTYTLLPTMNVYAVIIALATFAICKVLISYSKLIPAPIFGLGFGLIAAATFWKDKGLVLIKDKYGKIPTDFSVITMPAMPEMTSQVVSDIIYFALAIYIVAAIESLLCSRMADRLAENKGIPFNPNKELWGKAW